MGLLGQHRIPLVGIVGGIGSGKSAVANWVAANANVTVINADNLGHEALEALTVKNALILRFGPEIVGTDGAIVRSAIARFVFGTNPEQIQARKDLEAIVHPEIRRRILELETAAATNGFDAVLLDAAILLETGWRNLCSLVVYIDTPDEIRLKRVQETRGWTIEDLRRREESQWSLADKRKQSDIIVQNDRDLDFAGQQLLLALQQQGLITGK